jgi:hypothetical protein
MVRVLARLAATVGQLAIVPFAGFVCAVAAVAFEWPPRASDVHPAYYVALASIIPVLLLALMLETAAILPVGAVVERVRTVVADAHETVEELAEEMGSELGDAQHHLADATRNLQRIEDEQLARITPSVWRLRWTVRGFFVAAVAGEVASLYAVACQTSTPSVFALSTVEALALVVMVAIAFELRFVLD